MDPATGAQDDVGDAQPQGDHSHHAAWSEAESQGLLTGLDPAMKIEVSGVW